MVKRIKLETKSEEKSERTKEQDTGNKTDAIKIYKFRNLFTYEELEADGEFEDALCMYRFCTMLQGTILSFSFNLCRSWTIQKRRICESNYYISRSHGSSY